MADIVRLQAARTPKKSALSFEGRTDSFTDLNNHIDRASNAMRSAGVAEGERVAFLSHNNRALVVLRFAALRIGAVFTPINFMLQADEVAFILDHFGATAFVVEDGLCPIAVAALAALPNPPRLTAFIRHTGSTASPDWIDADAWLEHPDDGPIACTRGEDAPAQLMYTSGTESRPKGALLSSRALLAQYASCAVDQVRRRERRQPRGRRGALQPPRHR